MNLLEILSIMAQMTGENYEAFRELRNAYFRSESELESMTNRANDLMTENERLKEAMRWIPVGERMNIQKLEDALMMGRSLTITIDFVDDEEGNPVADWSVTEDGKPLASYLNCDSVEEALEEISEAIWNDGREE